jgi:coenzyme F420-0:L-glutamate ligase / coenzyme F420-1:gamma-L-glutamate ligase
MDTTHDPHARTTQTSLSDLLRARRSVRRYLPIPIAPRTIDALLEAATAAPSAHNRQPWRFVVAEALQTKAALANAMGARLRADRLRDGDALESIEADVARSHARLTSAPALIVVCMSMADMDRYVDDERTRAEHTMATQGVAMAAQNLLLCAHAAGLAACWMCAPLFCPEVVSSALRLPDDWEPQAILTLGFAAEEGKPFRRRPARELTHYQDRDP